MLKLTSADNEAVQIATDKVLGRRKKYSLSPELLAKKRAIGLVNIKKAQAARLSNGFKRKGTLIKEEAEKQAREYFMQEALKKLPQLTKVELAHALIDADSRHWSLNQLIGKPKETTDINVAPDQLREIGDSIKILAGVKGKILTQTEHTCIEQPDAARDIDLAPVIDTNTNIEALTHIQVDRSDTVPDTDTQSRVTD